MQETRDLFPTTLHPAVAATVQKSSSFVSVSMLPGHRLSSHHFMEFLMGTNREIENGPEIEVLESTCTAVVHWRPIDVS